MAASATLLACVLAAALLAAGPASAASRGFRLHNHSRHALRLESAGHLPRVICNTTLCVPTHYPVAFEGRPHDGAVLHPGGTHAWELKYGFSLILHETQYAAVLRYKIEGTDGTVEYTIQTTPTTNDSACKVVPAHVGHCTAGGLQLSFRNH
jgi:hypothetical protein